MKAVFEILPDSVDAGKSILVCEISNEGFSYAIKNTRQNTYVALALFHFDKSAKSIDYGQVLQNTIQKQLLLSGNFKKVFIMYSFGESVLIPVALYSSPENKNVLNLIHGDIENDVSILTDIIVDNGIYNTYRVPAPIFKVFKSKFPDAVNRHQYSVLLEQLPAKEDKLFIIFYPQKIVLKLDKNGRTELINSFYYNNAEDVSYILLNVCKQFEVENIPIEVSGLIEKDSALYKEIYKYFESVSFASLPAGSSYSEEITQHPSHYFSHIFAVDPCE